MRGNSDTKVLRSLEDPQKLFKRKDKEKLVFPLFGTSSSQDSPVDLEWEVNVGRSLWKTKSESDLKNNEFNFRILESYLLDSLWRDLLPCIFLLYYMTSLRIIPKEFLYLMEKVT